MLTSLPNLLTLSRILVIPIVVALICVQEAYPAYAAYAAWAAASLFAAACVTDWLDGHVARLWKQQSELGRFLDPIADKLLVGATLFGLAAKQHITGWAIFPALIILCREILVSGLREYLAGLRVGMPSSRLAKWKTGIQMAAIGFLLVGQEGPDWLRVPDIGVFLLWIAAGFTLATGYDYLRLGLSHIPRFSSQEPQPVAEPAPQAKPSKAA